MGRLRTASAPEEQIGLGDCLDVGMVTGRESQDSQVPGLAIFTETGNTGGGIGFFGER